LATHPARYTFSAMRYIVENPQRAEMIVLLYALVATLLAMLALAVPPPFREIVGAAAYLAAPLFAIWSQYYVEPEGRLPLGEYVGRIAGIAAALAVAFYILTVGCAALLIVAFVALVVSFGLCYGAAWLAVPVQSGLRGFVDPERGDRCLKCGYDLTGNVSGRCSECGEPLTCPRCKRGWQFVRDGVCSYCGFSRAAPPSAADEEQT
jgi:hypothetical protein